ncbi:MAG: hypothetical protein LC737_08335 [Chloroflexi bacterium]|nr:hypothetical protein [Chloroflexota bacterium]
MALEHMTPNALAQLIAFTPLGATLTPVEESFIARNGVSSFVLFARNLPDLDSARRLIARLHELAEQPLIAVDQEGGRVTRLPPPATPFPSAMALGATYAKTQSSALAREAGQATARELRAMNINVVLAPVLDVNSNTQNPVIGTRSFGDDAHVVSVAGGEWARGVQDGGVAACAKHFQYGIPGAAVEAVRAGCDLLCVITQYEQTLSALQRALNANLYTRERVEQSVARLHRLREWIAERWHEPDDPA